MLPLGYSQNAGGISHVLLSACQVSTYHWRNSLTGLWSHELLFHFRNQPSNSCDGITFNVYRKSLSRSFTSQICLGEGSDKGLSVHPLWVSNAHGRWTLCSSLWCVPSGIMSLVHVQSVLRLGTASSSSVSLYSRPLNTLQFPLMCHHCHPRRCSDEGLPVHPL